MDGIPADETTWLRRHSISQTHIRLYSSTDNSFETVASMTVWEFESRGGEYGSVIFNINREIVGEALDFGQASVPEGQYDFYYLSATFGTGSRFNPGLELKVEAGQYMMGLNILLHCNPSGI
jgi:hypothetical protein